MQKEEILPILILLIIWIIMQILLLLLALIQKLQQGITSVMVTQKAELILPKIPVPEVHLISLI